MLVVMVYLQPFRRYSVLNCVTRLEITKNSLNSLFWVFKIVQGHHYWHPYEARHQCHVYAYL